MGPKKAGTGKGGKGKKVVAPVVEPAQVEQVVEQDDSDEAGVGNVDVYDIDVEMQLMDRADSEGSAQEQAPTMRKAGKAKGKGGRGKAKAAPVVARPPSDDESEEEEPSPSPKRKGEKADEGSGGKKKKASADDQLPGESSAAAGPAGKRKPRTVKPKGVTPPTRTPILRNCKTNNQDASGDAEVVKVKKAPVRKQANKSKKENDANAKSKKMLEEDLALSDDSDSDEDEQLKLTHTKTINVQSLIGKREVEVPAPKKGRAAKKN